MAQRSMGPVNDRRETERGHAALHPARLEFGKAVAKTLDARYFYA